MDTDLLCDIAIAIGPNILDAYRPQIIAFASQNFQALCHFIAPFVLPAIKALAIAAVIVLTAVVVAYVTKRVANWIRDELRGEGLRVC